MYPLDVAIGPWRASIDLLTIDTVGWGLARATVPRGAVCELPSLPFLSSAKYSQPELGLLLFPNPDPPEGRDVSHLVIWSDREYRITEKGSNKTQVETSHSEP